MRPWLSRAGGRACRHPGPGKGGRRVRMSSRCESPTNRGTLPAANWVRLRPALGRSASSIRAPFPLRRSRGLHCDIGRVPASQSCMRWLHRDLVLDVSLQRRPAQRPRCGISGTQRSLTTCPGKRCFATRSACLPPFSPAACAALGRGCWSETPVNSHATATFGVRRPAGNGAAVVPLQSVRDHRRTFLFD